MGASNFTYAAASWTQALVDWIGAHTRAFAAIGGVTHYDTAILTGWPAPAARDKTKVEVAVPVIERWLLGSLRHRRCYSLAELNAAIGELLRQLNVGRRIRVVPLRSWL
jgi:hypothetical protein